MAEISATSKTGDIGDKLTAIAERQEAMALLQAQLKEKTSNAEAMLEAKKDAGNKMVRGSSAS